MKDIGCKQFHAAAFNVLFGHCRVVRCARRGKSPYLSWSRSTTSPASLFQANTSAPAAFSLSSSVLARVKLLNGPTSRRLVRPQLATQASCGSSDAYFLRKPFMVKASAPLFAPVPTWSQLREGLAARRSEEHTSELQSLMRISYAVFCLKKK